MPTAHPHPTLTNRRRTGGVIVKSAVGLVVLGALGAGAWAMWSGNLNDAAVVKASDDLGRAQVVSFDIRTTANGELAARRQTEVRSPLQTRAVITEVVSEGSFVRKGDVLARLSTDALEKQLIDAEDRLIAAQNELNLAETNLTIQLSDNESALRQATLTVELAEIELQKWLEGDDRARRQELTLAIDRAEREVQRLTRKVEQSKQLFEREFISSDELELDEIALIEATSNLETARIRWEVYQEYEYQQTHKQLTSNVEEAKADLERVVSRNKTQKSNRESALEYARTRRDQRQQEVKDIRDQIDAATIKAPNDGLVVYGTSSDRGWRNDDEPIAIGKEMNPNEVIIILPDTTEMQAVVRIHEAMIGRVRTGQRANIRIDAVSDHVFEGVVDSIGILAESGGWRDPNLREYEVRIALDANPLKTELKPSMRCEAEIVLGQVADALSIPVQAVFMQGDVAFVYKPEAGRFAPSPVIVGRRSSTMAEVVAGLDAGDTVLLRRPGPSEIVRREFDMEKIEAMRSAANDQRAATVRPAANAPDEPAAPETEHRPADTPSSPAA
ncbi:MAG: efflux RND transporter periplasmic adaptor subunit [Phycisphaerales bacterium]